MRLHSLQVAAFGPFVEEQQVDFDDLGSAGLFLVHGPTGAGKTSVLDAVCYALFNNVPGDRSARGLRSDLAPPDQPARVRLELSIGTRRLRIERHSEFNRPKLRGVGHVRVQGKVTLTELEDTGWVLRTTRLDEAADLIDQLLGLGLEQFKRVALLPQGDFAAFLTAGDEDRRKLLERLFDVGTFTGVENWFAQERRTRARAVEDAHRELAVHLGHLGDTLAGAPAEVVATGLAEPPPAEVASQAWLIPVAPDTTQLLRDLPQLPVAQWPARGLRLRAAVEDWETQALADLETASAADVNAAAQRDSTRRLAALIERGRTARAALDQLDDRSTAIDADRLRLDAATRASAVRAELDRADQAAIALDEVRELVERLARELTERGIPVSGDSLSGDDLVGHDLVGHDLVGHDLVGDDRPGDDLVGHDLVGDDRPGDDLVGHDLSVVAARLAQADGVLADAFARCRAGSALAGDVVAADQRLAASSRARQRAVTGLETALAELAQQGTTVDSLGAEAARVDALRHGLDLATRRVTGHDQRTKALAEATGLEESLTLARRTLLADQETLLHLRQARLDDLAGELAALLADDVPCPVCGSAQHPAPASHRPHWSPALIAEAEEALAASQAGASNLAEKLAAVTARAEARTEDLRGLDALDVDRDTLLDALADATAAHAAATATRDRLTAAKQQQEILRSEVAAQQDAVARIQLDVAAATATQAELTGRLAAAREQARELLERHTADCPCATVWTVADSGDEVVTEAVVTAVRRRHTETMALVQDQIRAQARLAEAIAAESAATAALRSAVDEAELGTAELARSALLDVASQTALQSRVVAHDRALAAHQATLAEAEVVAALDLAETVDVAAAEAAHVHSREQLLAAQAQSTLAARMARAVETQVGAVCRIAAALDPAERELAELTALADLVVGAGGNTLRMRLSSFVLAAHLERVVELANERLAVMGEGRYQLQHDDSLAARGARSGLGLLVRDEWSGQTRPPSTLSGGESFMTSLALALGLADAVRESAGGVELETLFVDEGFGSLDEESLEHVMTVLDGLREGGRAVGVISHVADMRDRIPRRLEVRKSPLGSRLISGATGSAA